MAALLCLPALELCGLGSCLVSGVCTVGRLCCCAFGAASGGSKGLSTRTAKAANIMILALSAIIATVLYTYGSQITWLSSISVINEICTNNGTTDSACFGSSAALRLSLGLCLFFCLTSLTAFSADFYVGCWGLKIMLWLGLCVGSFFLPESAIAGYGQTARIFSCAFLLAMVVIIIDAAHSLHEYLTGKEEDTDAALREKYDDIGFCQNCWRWLHRALIATFSLGSLTGISVLYHFSANTPSGVACPQNLGFLSVTLFAGLLMLLLGFLPSCGGGRGSRGLLAPSMIFAYCTWLCWNAISNNSDPACSPLTALSGGDSSSSSSGTGLTVVGMLIAAASLCYTAFSASRSLPHLFDGPGASASASAASTSAEAEPLSPGSTGSAKVSATAASSSSSSSRKADEDEEEGGRADGSAAMYARDARRKDAKAAEDEAAVPHSVLSAFTFMAIMALASMYMAPVLTNWVSNPADVVGTRNSPASMWVQVASEWATILLFLWTMVAPWCCPGRDFSGRA